LTSVSVILVIFGRCLASGIIPAARFTVRTLINAKCGDRLAGLCDRVSSSLAPPVPDSIQHTKSSLPTLPIAHGRFHALVFTDSTVDDSDGTIPRLNLDIQLRIPSHWSP
jgi:hypothetical protein